eukprot:PhM_4_TR3187/c0_g1_i1/m.58966
MCFKNFLLLHRKRERRLSTRDQRVSLHHLLALLPGERHLHHALTPLALRNGDPVRALRHVLLVAAADLHVVELRLEVLLLLATLLRHRLALLAPLGRLLTVVEHAGVVGDVDEVALSAAVAHLLEVVVRAALGDLGREAVGENAVVELTAAGLVDVLRRDGDVAVLAGVRDDHVHAGGKRLVARHARLHGVVLVHLDAAVRGVALGGAEHTVDEVARAAAGAQAVAENVATEDKARGHLLGVAAVEVARRPLRHKHVLRRQLDEVRALVVEDLEDEAAGVAGVLGVEGGRLGGHHHHGEVALLATLAALLLTLLLLEALLGTGDLHLVLHLRDALHHLTSLLTALLLALLGDKVLLPHLHHGLALLQVLAALLGLHALTSHHEGLALLLAEGQLRGAAVLLAEVLVLLAEGVVGLGLWSVLLGAGLREIRRHIRDVVVEVHCCFLFWMFFRGDMKECIILYNINKVQKL